jgi:hypothetical protein
MSSNLTHACYRRYSFIPVIIYAYIPLIIYVLLRLYILCFNSSYIPFPIRILHYYLYKFIYLFIPSIKLFIYSFLHKFVIISLFLKFFVLIYTYLFIHLFTYSFIAKITCSPLHICIIIYLFFMYFNSSVIMPVFEIPEIEFKGNNLILNWKRTWQQVFVL